MVAYGLGMVWSRRTLLLGGGVVALCLAVVLLAWGCQPKPAEPVPFEAFAVRESGGVDGRNHQLEVLPDGTALLQGRTVAAGQIDDPTMQRLEQLLTSEDLRREATETAQEQEEGGRQHCSDVVMVGVEMGPLWVAKDTTCGEKDSSKPALDEILGILSGPLDGSFTAPVRTAEPQLRPMTVELMKDPAAERLVVTITASGQSSLINNVRTLKTDQLQPAEADAVRLLQQRILDGEASSCASSPYRITIQRSAADGGNRQVCGDNTNREIRSVGQLVEDHFEI